MRIEPNPAPTGVLTPDGGAQYSQPALDIFQAMEVQPTTAAKNLIAQTVDRLIRLDIWNRLDVLSLLSAHTAQAACLNWKDPDNFPFVPRGGVVPVGPYKGYKGNGSVSQWYLERTGVPLSTYSNYTDRNCSIGVWCLDNGPDSKSLVGTLSSLSVRIAPLSGNVTRVRANDFAVSQFPFQPPQIPTAAGLTSFNRTGQTVLNAFRNGLAVENTSGATAGSRPDSPLVLLRDSSAGDYTTLTIGAVWVGASLTADQQMEMFRTILGYLRGTGTPFTL